jgi:DNA polymerase-3 subunit beta
MKFTCDKQEFCDAVTNVSKAVAVKSPVQALEGIKLVLKDDMLSLTAYNLEIGIRTQIEVANVQSGKECVINAKLLGDIARKMPGESITVAIDDKLFVKITSDNAEYTISAVDSAEFPDLPEIKEDKFFSIAQPMLKSMVNGTAFAVGTNDAKPVLTGLLLEIEESNFCMVAMDGYRLAVRQEKVAVPEDFKFIVPSKTMLDIARILKDDDECKVSVDIRHAKFELNGYEFFTRLIEGEYHRYRNNIGENGDIMALINTSQLIGALERCSLLISEKNASPVKFKIEESSARVKCETVLGKVEDTIKIEKSGDDFLVGFNVKFMLDALKASETDQVKIYFTAKNKPIKVVPIEGESFVYIIMPVIIDDKF